ncbi:hypothetical protein CSKR_106060 [Clonorchis sinensis]|uniref:Uncharacterized protein n=1 Tax=Clonorchis sinensis TaxID=79923 RepID=A0A419Q7E0_CLOSI|nr:hypothetical protein CSKR_106060 [Clonorchis sinensis]
MYSYLVVATVFQVFVISLHLQVKHVRRQTNVIIIVSMTSVLNTDASLPYNHDSFEILIVKNKGGRGKGLSASLLQAFRVWIETDIKNATEIGWQPYLLVSPTRRSGDLAVPILEGEYHRHSELGMENSTLFGKR